MVMTVSIPTNDDGDDVDDDYDDQERVLWADGEGGETPLQQHWPSGRFSP